MNFGTSRASAIEKLNKFVEQNLFEYSRLRNFDYGPNNRSNISCLSPYITHGVISELEVIPDLPNFKLSKTSFALLPIDETIPNPVITTRCMVFSFFGLDYASIIPICNFTNKLYPNTNLKIKQLSYLLLDI